MACLNHFLALSFVLITVVGHTTGNLESTEFLVAIQNNDDVENVPPSLTFGNAYPIDADIEIVSSCGIFSHRVPANSANNNLTLPEACRTAASSHVDAFVQENLGIHVTASSPVTLVVNIQDRLACCFDSFAAIPVQQFGTEYIAVTSSGDTGMTIALYMNTFTAIATIENTEVQVYDNSGTLRTTKLLNKWDTLTYSSGSDITGWNIKSNFPVGFTTGTRCTSTSAYGDGIFVEMVPPVSSFGTEFPLVDIPEDTLKNVRIVAAEDNTTVDIEGVRVGTIDKYQFRDLTLQQGIVAVLRASKPIYIWRIIQSTQGSGGSTVTIPPLVFGRINAQLLIPNFGTALEWQHYVQILIPGTRDQNLHIDNVHASNMDFRSSTTKTYSVATQMITADTHSISCDVCAITVYGIALTGQYGGNYGFVGPSGFTSSNGTTPENDNSTTQCPACPTSSPWNGNSPCGGHGSCTCVCDPGYTGKNCETEIQNVMVASKCQYGSWGNTACQSGYQCVPEDPSCLYEECANTDGWCIPKRSSGLRKHRK